MESKKIKIIVFLGEAVVVSLIALLLSWIFG